MIDMLSNGRYLGVVCHPCDRPRVVLANMICYALLCLVVATDAAWQLEKQHCGYCNTSVCPSLHHCSGATVKDPCHCCWVCAREKGDKCGGPWSLFGSCGHGMTCKPAAQHAIETGFVGECKTREFGLLCDRTFK